MCICDINSKKLNEAYSYIKDKQSTNESNNLFIKKFVSYENLIGEISKNKIKIDLIVIATPSGLHAKQDPRQQRNLDHWQPEASPEL